MSLFLSSCAHEPAQNTNVLLGERSDLYFTGRGSAAGIMMDAYMGGAGVAIGIAIDEGIAKEIAAGLRTHNPDFSIVKLFDDVLQDRTDVALSGLIFVKIDKYGFQAAPSDNVIPLIEAVFTCKSGASQKVKYESVQQQKLITFEQVKTDGALAESALENAVQMLVRSNADICIASKM